MVTLITTKNAHFKISATNRTHTFHRRHISNNTIWTAPQTNVRAASYVKCCPQKIEYNWHNRLETTYRKLAKNLPRNKLYLKPHRLLRRGEGTKGMRGKVSLRKFQPTITARILNQSSELNREHYNDNPWRAWSPNQMNKQKSRESIWNNLVYYWRGSIAALMFNSHPSALSSKAPSSTVASTVISIPPCNISASQRFLICYPQNRTPPLGRYPTITH